MAKILSFDLVYIMSIYRHKQQIDPQLIGTDTHSVSLRVLAEECSFVTLTNRLIRD